MGLSNYVDCIRVLKQGEQTVIRVLFIVCQDVYGPIYDEVDLYALGSLGMLDVMVNSLISDRYVRDKVRTELRNSIFALRS